MNFQFIYACIVLPHRHNTFVSLNLRGVAGGGGSFIVRWWENCHFPVNPIVVVECVWMNEQIWEQARPKLGQAQLKVKTGFTFTLFLMGVGEGGSI